MIRAASCLALAQLAFVAAAQASPWPPAPDHPQIPLWSGAPPDAFTVTASENTTSDPKELIGGKTVIAVNDVTKPTLTLYRPPGRNTGAAVVVFPGGGYWLLAIDLEGTEVCDWLTANGIA